MRRRQRRWDSRPFATSQEPRREGATQEPHGGLELWQELWVWAENAGGNLRWASSKTGLGDQGGSRREGANGYCGPPLGEGEAGSAGGVFGGFTGVGPSCRAGCRRSELRWLRCLSRPPSAIECSRNRIHFTVTECRNDCGNRAFLNGLSK
ncbi:hypothetical protein VUR80DRAFT_10084 [Thermomyces stellatus]